MPFAKREAGAYTLRRILQDIKKAKEYGIELHNDITLNEMYSHLREAEKQKIYTSTRGVPV